MANKTEPIESPTRTARMNVAVTAGLLVLLAVVVFVGQNSQSVSVKFLGWNGHIGLGLALLLGAIAGGLMVTLFGMARILQLRHRAKKAVNANNEPVIDLHDGQADMPAEPIDPLTTSRLG